MMKKAGEKIIETGKVTKWEPEKNYGFIDYNIHFRRSDWDDEQPPERWLVVEFVKKQGSKSLVAEHIKIKKDSKRQENYTPAESPAPITEPSTQSQGLSNPYQFIKLNTNNTVTDTPIWHDGIGNQTLLTGEMGVTLTALTPLLVGQWQYKAKDLENRGSLKPHTNVDDKKSILEPLRLNDGRVVLPGSSIKGMIRNSLSALLSAPMERVAERSYSYRPNAQFSNGFRGARPALIIAADAQQVTVRVLSSPTSVHFVRKEAITCFPQTLIAKRINKVHGVCLVSNGTKKRIEPKSGSSIGPGYYANYDGGIDGKGELHRRFKKSQGKYGDVYQKVWIEDQEYEKAKDNIQLPEDVIRHYQATLEHLIDDNGHFASGYPGEGAKEAIQKIKLLQKLWQIQSREDLVGRLIYVELEDDNKITSMGHHYYYRWRYANTIHTLWQSPGQYTVRAILAPVAQELSTHENGKPHKLSAARLLFGYTSGQEKDPLKQVGSANIGNGTFQRLAGRLHINAAVEQLNGKVQRFVKDGQVLPLKPLGLPRPSAVEHYLIQPRDQHTGQNGEQKVQTGREQLKEIRNDGGQMLTYGDLPAKFPAEDQSNEDCYGELAGRKFYLHQPDANQDENLYLTDDDSIIASEQAMLARFVTSPDVEFRFSLRFKDLRPWELGALLLVLEPATYLPTVLAKLIELIESKPERKNALENLLSKINTFNQSEKTTQPPLFAHKLGHARPLGLGSVLLKCDQLKLLDTDKGLPTCLATDLNPSSPAVAQWLTACAEKIAENLHSTGHLENWCAVHQYAGRTRSAYPTALPTRIDPKKVQVATIFQYHSNARNAHIASRRLRSDKSQLSTAILNPLPFNPKP